MEFADIRRLLALLQEADIPVCVVGELALNYYNAPRIVHVLELCVRVNDLEVAASIFESEKGLLERQTKLITIFIRNTKEGFHVFNFILSIAALPLPRFVPLFMGFCRTYIETQEVTAAIAAELLVDGMNLDGEWCQAHFHASQIDELSFVLRLIRGKSSRIADFSPNEVTCFIADYQEAQRIRKIPGFS
ncbi:hypothetical protein EMCG_08422 [[Emmonsia] crescens]|uniref:Uncharacterized protein n=1 Tax=[Emmonsia] crescens TaxID=73230 RepID=A0A0G2I5Q3_9EURO|nr:hypothetical protein EMCG_08422 [Emmonsia crescens UAMH 3008]